MRGRGRAESEKEGQRTGEKAEEYCHVSVFFVVVWASLALSALFLFFLPQVRVLNAFHTLRVGLSFSLCFSSSLSLSFLRPLEESPYVKTDGTDRLLRTSLSSSSSSLSHAGLVSALLHRWLKPLTDCERKRRRRRKESKRRRKSVSTPRLSSLSREE